MKFQAGFVAVAVLFAAQAHAQTQASTAAPSSAAAASAPLPTAKWSDAVEVIIHGPTAVTVHGACRVDLWKVTRGDAVVWVLPTLLTAPKRMDWDTTCVKKALAGAQGLLLPGPYPNDHPSPEPLPFGKDLSDVVSPHTYARFVITARELGLNPDTFSHDRPGWAAATFISQAHERMGVGHQTYPADLPDLARDAHVPIIDVKSIPVSRNGRNDLSAAEGEACLNSQLDRIDYVLNVLPVVVDAWKRGDMPALMANFDDEDSSRCVPEGARLKAAGDPNITAWTSAIDKALDQGGSRVAAVPLNWLLYRGGVLDRLATNGATVVPPKGLLN